MARAFGYRIYRVKEHEEKKFFYDLHPKASIGCCDASALEQSKVDTVVESGRNKSSHFRSY